MPLTYDLFKNDALIFEHMNTNEISIRSHKHNKFVKVEFDGFPFVGVWTPGDNAPFLCIEPWYGIADEVNPAKDFKNKREFNLYKRMKHLHVVTASQSDNYSIPYFKKYLSRGSSYNLEVSHFD